MPHDPKAEAEMLIRRIRELEDENAELKRKLSYSQAPGAPECWVYTDDDDEAAILASNLPEPLRTRVLALLKGGK